MASHSTSRLLQSVSRQLRTSCSCASLVRTASIRQYSATTPGSGRDLFDDPEQTPESPLPRWAATPSRMVAPTPMRIRNDRTPFEANSDPKKLDAFYVNFLGKGGDRVLTEEVKWLAVTHKSFDQGRRGFNDRLAFFGRRIVNLQASIVLVNSEVATETSSLWKMDDGHQRRPFEHPALLGLDNLVSISLAEALDKKRIAALATRLGTQDIARWTPRLIFDLKGSGQEVVLVTTIYAIIGAVALQRGGDVAALMAKEKILKPLGIA